jgi:HTH-type transcriptional regulator/antitoxin MqsA
MTMVVSKQELPDTIVSPENGETLRRGVRPFIVTYKGKSITVGLPGYYQEYGAEGVHVGNDMAVTDAALRALKEEKAFPPPPPSRGFAKS